MRGSRRDELARQAAEIEDLRPYLDLAREIQREVSRAVDDPSAGSEALAEAIERIPAEERRRVVRGVFDRLPADQQWAIIERVYADEEIATYLEQERLARRDLARRAALHGEIVRAARAEHRLDTTAVPTGELLTLGLFREPDAGAALSRGHSSTTCARRLVLRACAPGRFRVVEDVFNPSGAYFVTGDYDEHTWRASDRLPGHTAVRVGSLTTDELEPILYPGGRVDVEVSGRIVEGRLHLGFAMLGDRDVFADE